MLRTIAFSAGRPLVLASVLTTSIRCKSDALVQVAKQEIAGIHEAGTYKKERIITSEQFSQIKVKGGEGERDVLNFCANNYLGLANHKDLRESAKAAIDSHGLGLASVRFICGTQDIHKNLEGKIAAFHRKGDAILYASCFDANGGLFETLLQQEDAIISDQLNHASIIDGIRLSKARKYRYEHMNMQDLEQKLKEAQDARLRMVFTDGVFSMDGHIAPLKDICDLADKYNAIVAVDECHATGFFGKTGRGTPEYWGVEDRVDIVTSTLGKALGGATGGYTTGPKEVVDLLRNRSRPYLFSNTVPPAVVGASISCFDMLSSSTQLRDKLEKNTKLFRTLMTNAGFEIKGNEHGHPIVPIMLGDARLAAEFADDLLKEGIYVIGFSYPVVPKGLARIRVQVSAAHSEEQIRFAANAFIKVGKQRGVLV